MVAALARYVLLKCPDKADFRSRAADCAVRLTAGMPLRDRNDFVIFAARLSRTAKARSAHMGIPILAPLLSGAHHHMASLLLGTVMCSQLPPHD